MPVFSKLCWLFNSRAPTAYITTQTLHPTGTAPTFADSTSPLATASWPARAATEGTISTPSPASHTNIEHPASFGFDGHSDRQQNMAEEGSSTAGQHGMQTSYKSTTSVDPGTSVRLEQDTPAQPDQAATDKNTATLTSTESASVDLTMTDASTAEPDPAESLLPEATQSAQVAHAQVTTAAASNTHDKMEVCVQNDSPNTPCGDHSRSDNVESTLASAHTAETISSSPLPTYQPTPAFTAGYAAVQEPSEPSSDTNFSQHIASKFDNRNIGKGRSQNMSTQGTQVPNVAHNGKFSHGTTSKHPSTNASSDMRGTVSQFARHYNTPGHSRLGQASRGIQGFSPLPDFQFSNSAHELFGQAPGGSRGGQFGFQDHRHNTGFNPVHQGTSASPFGNMNTRSPYQMYFDCQPPPHSPFRAPSTPYAVHLPAREYVQGLNHSTYDQPSLSFEHSDEFRIPHMGGLRYSARKAIPPARLSAKRKAEDESEEELDADDDDDASGDEEPISGGASEETVAADPEQMDEYEPSEGSDEIDSDEFDSEDDVPLKDRRQQGGEQDEDDEENEEQVTIKKEDSSGAEEGGNEDHTGLARSLTITLPLPKALSGTPAGTLAARTPSQHGIQGPTKDNTAPLGSPTAEAPLPAAQSEANPEPDATDGISWKLPRYHLEVLPLHDKEEAPEVVVNLPGMPREVLALTTDHANQEIQLLKDLFLPGQQALATPDPWPKQALLNFHTVATMVLEAYTAYEVGDLHTKGSIAPDKDEDKEIAALDATKDEIFFAVIDRWRVGLAEETLRPGYKLIRGAQEFCDIALDVIHYLEEHGFIEGPQMIRAERKKQAAKEAAEKEVKKGASAKKVGRPKKEDGGSPAKPKGKAAGKAVHQPPVRKKAKTTPAPKVKKGPTLSVVKRGKGDF